MIWVITIGIIVTWFTLFGLWRLFFAMTVRWRAHRGAPYYLEDHIYLMEREQRRERRRALPWWRRGRFLGPIIAAEIAVVVWLFVALEI